MATKARLPVGVVGLAGIGMAHLMAVAALPGEYRLVGVADADEERSRTVGTGFSVPAFTSLADLVAAGDVEAVVLAVPPAAHGPMTRQALAAGLHVYCEKPLTPTAAEGRALGTLARARGRVVQIGLQYRFLPAYVEAAALVRAGAIGAVRRVEVTATGWFRPRHYFRSRPWRARWADVGGGVLMHQACHQLDALVSVVGAPVRVTAGAWRSLHDVEVEDSAALLFELAGGARGTLVASSAEPAGANRTEIHGERGSLVIAGFGLRRAALPAPAGELAATAADDLPAVAVDWSEEVADGGRAMEFSAIVACHRDFLAAVRGEVEQPRNHPTEAARAIEVINAAYLSALRGTPVPVPPDDDAYALAFRDLCDGRAGFPRVDGSPGPPAGGSDLEGARA